MHQNTNPRFPSLFQINTRIWLRELAQALGRPAPATLDDVPDEELDKIARLGFDVLWLIGIWQTGPGGRGISLAHPELQLEYRELLSDFTPDDVCGSPFAVQGYEVHTDFGGIKALTRFRRRLHDRGLRLLLDFVPNHTALDHPWVYGFPEFYIQGQEEDLVREPHNYMRVATRSGLRTLAHGRDPHFPGWTDTLQLNYRHMGLREAMVGELKKIAGLCDGVRCDMAMLLLPDVIARTWGDKSLPADGTAPVDASFWPDATERIHRGRPGFLFMAEVYWNLEWTLQQQGFDYTYDKLLYDLLRAEDAPSVRAHLLADPEYVSRSVHFIENHDVPRAAAVFQPAVHRAAAVLCFSTPGMRFFHEGQLSGRTRKTSIHLSRRPSEPPNRELKSFYTSLLECLKLPEPRDSTWHLLTCLPAWEGNPTWDRFIAFTWDPIIEGSRRLLVAVNYGPTQGQCFVQLPFLLIPERTYLLHDLLSPIRYEREGLDLTRRGLYLNMPAWAYHVFEVLDRRQQT